MAEPTFEDRWAPVKEAEQQESLTEAKKRLNLQMREKQAAGRAYTVEELHGGFETPYGGIKYSRKFNPDGSCTEKGEVSIKYQGFGPEFGGERTRKNCW